MAEISQKNNVNHFAIKNIRMCINKRDHESGPKFEKKTFMCTKNTNPFLHPGVDQQKDLPLCTIFTCTNNHLELKLNDLKRELLLSMIMMLSVLFIYFLCSVLNVTIVTMYGTNKLFSNLNLFLFRLIMVNLKQK